MMKHSAHGLECSGQRAIEIELAALLANLEVDMKRFGPELKTLIGAKWLIDEMKSLKQGDGACAALLWLGDRPRAGLDRC